VNAPDLMVACRVRGSLSAGLLAASAVVFQSAPAQSPQQPVFRTTTELRAFEVRSCAPARDRRRWPRWAGACSWLCSGEADCHERIAMRRTWSARRCRKSN